MQTPVLHMKGLVVSALNQDFSQCCRPHQGDPHFRNIAPRNAPPSCAVTPNLLLVSTVLFVLPVIYPSQRVYCSTWRDIVAALSGRWAPPTRLLCQEPSVQLEWKHFQNCSACQPPPGGILCSFCYMPSIQWDGRKWQGSGVSSVTCASGEHWAEPPGWLQLYWPAESMRLCFTGVSPSFPTGLLSLNSCVLQYLPAWTILVRNNWLSSAPLGLHLYPGSYRKT